MSRRITNSSKVQLTENQLRSSDPDGKLLLTDFCGQKAALFLSGNRLMAARFYPEGTSKVGAVYIGKVKNYVKNLDAYFVEIGGTGNHEREICFLSHKDSAYPYLLNRRYDGRILEGDEFPVQIIRDAQKTKQASVTTLLSVSDEYLALSIGNPRTGYSNKLSPGEKGFLKKILESRDFSSSAGIAIPPSQFSTGLPVGLIVRTKTAQWTEGEEEEAASRIKTQLDRLKQCLYTLYEDALHRTCYSCLKRPAPFWVNAVSSLVRPYEYNEILTDEEVIYQELLDNRDSLPEHISCRLYTAGEAQQIPLAGLYGLKSKLDTALNRRVWLKSGGYLVIDITEALTVIDVNSGKYEATKGAEESYRSINLEAAVEIALQLRLRNLSGIILVDFINMKTQKDQEELLQVLREYTKRDTQKVNILDITALGLVEITRKKSYSTLAEQLNPSEKPGAF